MSKKIGFAAAIAALLALVVMCHAGGAFLQEKIIGDKEVSGKANKGTDGEVVVIDPGHGGMDGGKVGANGVEEKEVNLKISLGIKKLLEKEGIQVIMTRTDDERLADNQVGDLKARVDIMNKNNPELVVSIHQNSYHEESVRGAQVFYYGDSKEGKEAAVIIQEALKEVDTENTKEAKANNTYYILKKTKVPVVIAECGFLSNYEEAQKLADEAYQQELAAAVAKGILQYMESR